MSALTWNDVTAMFPNLSAIDTAVQNQILAFVAAQMDPTVWDTMLNTGGVYLAAHLAAVSKKGVGGGASGPVMSEGVGQVNRGYAALQGAYAASPLSSTAYGAEYLRLLRTRFGSRVFVLGGV